MPRSRSERGCLLFHSRAHCLEERTRAGREAIDNMVPALPFEPGVVLANTWQAERRIASGGFSEVWAGIELGSGREVALKRLLPGAAREPALVERFEQEALILQRIHSQFVVRHL